MSHVEQDKEPIKGDSPQYAFLTDDKYTLNKELDSKYKELVTPVGNRIKNCVFYNICVVFGYYYFARNISYFRKKYQSGRELSNSKILRTTFLYTFIPALLLAPNVFILFGSNPLKYFREKRQLEEQLLGGKEMKDALFGFDSMYKTDIATSFVAEKVEGK